MEEHEKIRVIVAEDMDILREGFCDIIAAQPDMTVAGSAASGREVCALAETVPCDVILMDIEMEHIHAGIQASERIHGANGDIKIIFLTIHETDDMITAAMASGAVDYVVKSCEDEVLCDHIRRAYRGETRLEPLVSQALMRDYKRLRQSEKSLLYFITTVGRLTPAERSLVKLLLEDKKIAEIAQIRQVEQVTVKTQIRSLLKKFGCSRTREIVKLIRQLGLEHLFL